MNSKEAWYIFKNSDSVIDYLVYAKIKNFEKNKK